MARPQRVAIIGGGASGLVTLRHLSAELDAFAPTLFEMTDSIGGTWVYTDRTGLDQYGLPIHSSMYKHLRTNLPKELMAYLDFPFTQDGPSFLGHEDVLHYLKNYCKHFKLQNYIQFRTKVVSVKPLRTSEPQRWSVEVQNVETKSHKTLEFDKIVIATGHYHETRYVDIPNFDQFKGVVMHSHSYRVPEPFSGMNVLCIGAGSSGIDISIELSSVANKVALCHDHQKMFTSPFPCNHGQLPWPTGADNHGFHFKDGRYFEADAIVFCTGYEYSYPFLHPDCGLSVVDHRVVPLYKHLIHIQYSSLAIMCVPFTVIPFVVSDIQSQFLAKVFKYPSGTLPTIKEMAADTETEIERRKLEGYKSRHFHKFNLRIWEYLYDLVAIGNLKPIPISREKLHRLSHDERLMNFCNFRDVDYSVTNDEVSYR